VSIERAAFKKLLNPLCAMFRAQFDVAQWTVYFHALSDISATLLEEAIVLASRDTREFMPRPGELRAYAETARVAKLAATPWKPCGSCESLNGFIEITDDHGVKRLTKCGCQAAHRVVLEKAGIPSRPLIEAPVERHTDASAWDDVPDIDPCRLPAPIASQVKQIARAHDMRARLSRESVEKAGRSVDLTPQTDLDGRPLPPLRERSTRPNSTT
jgi:hypothetical protein